MANRRRSTTPLRLLLVMVLGAFVGEALVMGVISLLPPMAVFPEALFDATALTLLLFPVLYFAAFRPLVGELRERREADAALTRLNEELEARIAERTSQLAAANSALRLEVAERARSERRYRDLFEHNLAGVYRSTLDGRLLDCNPAFALLYGYDSPEELLATPAVQLYPDPDARAAFVSALRGAGKLLAFECPGQTRDGRRIWLLENVALVPGREGESPVIEGTAFDITGRKAAEAERERLVAELAEERERVAALARDLEAERDVLATTMENTRAHLAFLDRDFTFVQANAAYAKGSRLRREDLIGRNHFELFPDAASQAIFEKVRDNGETIEFHARPFDFPDQPERGTTYWDWTLAPVKDRAGNVVGLVLSLLDVTELIRVEQALRAARDELEARVELRTAELARANEALATELAERSRTEELLRQREQTFRSLTENLPDVVSRFDRGFRHLFVSRQVEAATGVPRDRFLSHTNRELGFTGPLVDLWDRQLQTVFDSGEVRTFEFSIGEGEQTTWFESRLVPEFGADGTVATVLGIARDITVRRRSEEALQRSEQLLRTVLELLPVGVFLLDRDGTIVTGNAAAQRIWAGVRLVGPEEYGTYRAWSMETGEPLSASEWAAARAIREEASVLDQVVEIESFDGSRKVITNSAVPLRGPDGALTGIVVVNEDITGRVEAERSLRRFAGEQQALFTVTAAATARLDVERLLDSVLETVLPVMEADAGWVTVIGADPAGPPRVFAHRGLPREFVEAEASLPLDTCAACWPLVQGEPSSPVPWKLSKCARIPRPICVSTGLQSHVSVTLKSGDAVYGILNVGWRSEHDYDRVEHDLLEAIARQVGIALQNARLYRSEQEARRTAETLRAAGMALTGTLELASVESTLLDSLRELIPYDRARVMLREGGDVLVVRATVTGGKPAEIHRDPAPSFAIAGNPILAEILAGGKGVVIDDIYADPHWKDRVAPGFERSWMGVPLVAGNQVIGLYSLSKDEPAYFSARHLRLAEALAAPAAMAIQNAWLYEQLREGRAQLQTLSRKLVEVQEGERRAVARELHDEAGQVLTSLMIGLGLLEREARRPTRVLARAAELKQMADGIQENLHRLASNLRPAALDHVGLVSALRQYT
ncbi:MAG: PAS domain S-box protein, partial [Acidobacteriota bacterium]